MSLDLGNFTRGFVAALASGNLFSVQLKRPEQIRGFYKVRDFLQAEVQNAEKGDDRDWLQQVVRLRNRLAPSTSGSFDQLETAFRDLQLSLTESPNIYYEDIDFTISKPFAESTLQTFTDRERALIKKSAEIFMSSIAA